MALYKNSSIKLSILITLFIVISLFGCLSHWSGYEENDNDGGIDDKDVIFTMEFKEGTGWDDPGHEDWSRWHYEEQKELYDLSKMLTDDKVYIFTYSFRSDIDINSLGVYFYNTDSDNWEMITNWTYIIGNIKKYTIYSGKIVIIPETNAAGCDPKNTYMRFDIGNRNISVSATLSFYEFDLKQIDKEVSLDKWTISTGETFTIDTLRTFAEKGNFKDKTDVLHIKPSYKLPSYGDFVFQYDLSSYAGRQIKIEMSMDVYLEKDARIAWQVNSQDPYYPVICGAVAFDDRFPEHSGPTLSANTWHEGFKGSNTVIVPSSGDIGKLLYLSGQQIEGIEAYFANAAITIQDTTPNVSFESVTANGSSWEPKTTTELTLNFSQAISNLNANDIKLSGVNGVTSGTLKPIDSVPGAYTLDISGFTSSGTLTVTVTVKKDGYDITNVLPKTVDIIYSAFDSAVGLKSLTVSGSGFISVDTTTGIISRGVHSGAEDHSNYFSVKIPPSQFPINPSDTIVIKYIGFGDAPIIPKLPDSYTDLNPPIWDAVFTGDQEVHTYKIEAFKYGESIPTTTIPDKDVVTFQGHPNEVAWKLKIIDITVEH